MELFNLDQSNSYRLFFFVFGLGLFWVSGIAFQFRAVKKVDYWRWINNLALITINSAILRIVLPLTLVTFASRNSWGLLHIIEMPSWLSLFISIILLDMIIYFQHVLFHYNSFLWKLHSVHHSDTGFDTTTALRFHPIEILLSVLVKGISIFVFGLSPLAVLIFEIILNFSAMFNHSNFSLPSVIEIILSKVVVTPDFHRIHHSVNENETNSNFGFFLSVWDRLFRTNIEKSRNDLRKSDLGLEEYREIGDQRIDALLLQPFRGKI